MMKPMLGMKLRRNASTPQRIAKSKPIKKKRRVEDSCGKTEYRVDADVASDALAEP